MTILPMVLCNLLACYSYLYSSTVFVCNSHLSIDSFLWLKTIHYNFNFFGNLHYSCSVLTVCCIGIGHRDWELFVRCRRFHAAAHRSHPLKELFRSAVYRVMGLYGFISYSSCCGVKLVACFLYQNLIRTNKSHKLFVPCVLIFIQTFYSFYLIWCWNSFVIM